MNNEHRRSMTKKASKELDKCVVIVVTSLIPFDLPFTQSVVTLKSMERTLATALRDSVMVRKAEPIAPTNNNDVDELDEILSSSNANDNDNSRPTEEDLKALDGFADEEEKKKADALDVLARHTTDSAGWPSDEAGKLC